MTPTKQEKNEDDKYKTLPLCPPPPRVLVTSLVDYDTHHSRASTRHDDDAAAWTSPFAMFASSSTPATNRLTLSSLSSRSLAYANDRNKTKNNEDADPSEISFSSSSGGGSSSTTMRSDDDDDDSNNKSSTASSSSSSLLLENGRNNSNYYTCNSTTTTTTQKMNQVPSILKPSSYHPIKRHRCNINQGYYYKDGGIWAVTMLKPKSSSTITDMDKEYDYTATATCSSSKKSRTS